VAVTGTSGAFVTLDLGGATTAAALVGRVAGRWRLLASTAVPAAVDPEAAVELLGTIVRSSDPTLAAEVGLQEAPLRELPRLVSLTSRTPTLGLVGVTERALGPLGRAAERAGWRTWRASMERFDPLALLRFLLDDRIEAILAGAGDPAGADERGGLGELAAAVAAAAERRPGLPVVLAGALAVEAERHAFFAQRAHAVGPGGGGSEAPEAEPADAKRGVPAPARSDSERVTRGADGGPGPILLAPAATAGERPGEPLQRILAGLAARPDAGRDDLVRSLGSLAAVLELRIELVEIGHDGALRARAVPGPRTADPPRVEHRLVPGAALVPGEVTEELLDGVLPWSTVAVERSRLRDRLTALRREPWTELPGDGARLRLAAAEAALGRLVAATAELTAQPAPDLLVLAGGVWSAVPGPAVALAAANVLRRPGAWQIAYDQARLLAPLGTIAVEEDRRAVLADLAGDLLVPIGAVVMPMGLRAGPSAGTLVVHGPSGPTELDLVPGGLELVDLAPGERTTIELRFEHPVVLGTRGRRFALEVAGGLGGLLVDLRDIPLRLPDRAARRRELLGAWQAALWPGFDEGADGGQPR
jgi:hypothetical protein